MSTDAKRQKAQWTLDHESGISTVLLPSDLTASYDLKELPGVDWSTLGTETARMVVFYGHKQKLSDSVAKRKNEKLTDQERLDVMQLIHERLASDQWLAARMTADDLASIRLRKCKDEEQMNLLLSLGIVTAEQKARELLRREALA